MNVFKAQTGSKKKYLFIKIRSNHAIISQITKILKHAFPEFHMEVVEIKRLLKQQPLIIVFNIIHILRLYGIRSFFYGKDVFYNRFFGTPYMYQAIRKILKNNINDKEYIFSFQDCSLFNGKIGPLPHFIYTDHTVLENKSYPDYIEARDMLSNEWIMLERQIYHDSNVIFTRYEKIAFSLIEEYSCQRDKVKNIYYAPNIRQSAYNEEKYFSQNILFVGIDWARKGGQQLISAFAKVLEKVPTARLTIIGCSPRSTLNNVHVIGKVDSNRLVDYYNNAAVFCMPTRKEHAGIVFTEAMGYALPVVGTKIGAVPEYIQEGVNGYLIDVDDIDGLAEKLTMLVSDPKICLEFGNNSYIRYKELFSLEKVSNQIRSAILNALD